MSPKTESPTTKNDITVIRLALKRLQAWEANVSSTVKITDCAEIALAALGHLEKQLQPPITIFTGDPDAQ